MRKVVFFMFCVLFSSGIYSQDITGQWTGVLKVQGMQMRLVFNINKSDVGLSATMDSPDQGAKDIPVTEITFKDSTLKLSVSIAGIDYEGVLNHEQIMEGTFRQAGQSFPMDLTRDKVEKVALVRPQEPTQPYPYLAEDVSFPNPQANITLAGTLTLPQGKGPFPAVILITGSGSQNRDEELMGHKPFLVIADYLTKNGIAVLRYDDRGTAASTGDFSTATTMDFASDTESALAYLKSRKEIDAGKIGLAGHSEGGLIAPMVAGKTNDVAFVILLAGPGIKGKEILLMQSELIAKASGATKKERRAANKVNAQIYNMIDVSVDVSLLRDTMTSYLQSMLKEGLLGGLPDGMTEEQYIAMQVNQITSPWFINFIKYDPAPALQKVKCPVLALNGSKDLQVPCKVNLDAIRVELTTGGNKDFTVKELDNLNHLFQNCKTGSPNEYATIEETFSPVALKEMLDWIQKRFM